MAPYYALHGSRGLCMLASIGAFLAMRFQPIARQYFISTLQKRYQSDMELGDLQISLYPTVRASGDNLVFWFHGRRDMPPLVKIRKFTFEAGFFNFFRNPRHINRLRLEGLQIHVPPRSGEPRLPIRILPGRLQTHRVRLRSLSFSRSQRRRYPAGNSAEGSGENPLTFDITG